MSVYSIKILNNILLLEVLLKFWHGAPCLWRIGCYIGRLVKIDSTSSLTTRGKFDRSCTEINLKQKLVPYVSVRGRDHQVEYEGLHLVCFGCGRYGHHREI